MNEAYSNYKEWKGWDTPLGSLAKHAKYFDKEILPVLPSATARVLEVGFGHGEFLQWCKNRGLKPVGIELIKELVASAKNSGHVVYNADITKITEDDDLFEIGKFDCVVAFDVVEHLTVEEIGRFLQSSSKFLTKDGLIVLRFPNGESPFSMPLQNGDHTHRTVLTKLKLEHLCIGSPFQVMSYKNAARVINRRSIAPFKLGLFFLCNCVEILVGLMYHGKRMPLDPAVVAILRKTADES